MQFMEHSILDMLFSAEAIKYEKHLTSMLITNTYFLESQGYVSVLEVI